MWSPKEMSVTTAPKPTSLSGRFARNCPVGELCDSVFCLPIPTFSSRKHLQTNFISTEHLPLLSWRSKTYASSGLNRLCVVAPRAHLAEAGSILVTDAKLSMLLQVCHATAMAHSPHRRKTTLTKAGGTAMVWSPFGCARWAI